MQTKRKPALPEAELLDHYYLASLQNALGLAVTRDVLADGLIEVSDRLDHLTEEAKLGERQKASRIAHDIAGSAGHMGLQALSVAARKLEQDLMAEPPEPLLDRVADFLRLGPVSLTALRVHIDHLG
ncbi:MAG: Hpt domain-containing protein [Pseudomonadota bacterium]